jgi:hypothetical protein
MSARINKKEYKLFLLFVKYKPLFLAFLVFIRIVAVYKGVASGIFYKAISPSIFSATILLYMSYIFKYCWIHRIPLYYIISIYLYDCIASYICCNGLECRTLFIGELSISIVAVLIYLCGNDKDNKKFIV